MKYNSIKNQLMLTAIVSLLSMIVLVANQIYSSRIVIELHKERVLLLNLSNQLLQMRRSEKDFMMRLDPVYLTKVANNVKAFNQKIDQVFHIAAIHNLPADHAKTISKEVAQYSTLLNEMADIMAFIGQPDKDGELYKLTTIANQLNRQLETQNSKQQQLTLLNLRLAEQQYWQNKSTYNKQQYQSIAAQLALQIKNSELTDKQALLQTLSGYQHCFDVLVDAYNRLGYDHNSGLQKAFRDSAHKVENGLNELNQLLTPVIEQKEHNVNFVSSTILLINALILVFAIAKNFHRLRRAFKSFDKFFQESKHEKTLLDVQEVTFEEFKQLALVANEMIEERFRTEDELKQARDKLSQTNEQLSRANKELEEFASLDPLTKIANRRQLDLIRKQEWMRGIRQQQDYSVVLVDVDYFKAYNDNYGHQSGDDALVKVAKALVLSIKRSSDLVARYGGEEFAVVLPNTNAEAAAELARKMLKNVEQLAIEHQYSKVTDHVTVSAGVASAIPSIDEEPNSLFAKADKALYQAKELGRNQVVISET